MSKRPFEYPGFESTFEVLGWLWDTKIAAVAGDCDCGGGFFHVVDIAIAAVVVVTVRASRDIQGCLIPL